MFKISFFAAQGEDWEGGDRETSEEIVSTQAREAVRLGRKYSFSEAKHISEFVSYCCKPVSGAWVRIEAKLFSPSPQFKLNSLWKLAWGTECLCYLYADEFAHLLLYSAVQTIANILRFIKDK